MSCDNRLVCLLSLCDQLRREAPAFIRKLESIGIPDITMLTGDAENVAMDVSKQLGLRDGNCLFRLLPHQKLDWIKRKQGMEEGMVLSRAANASSEAVVGSEQVDLIQIQVDTVIVDLEAREGRLPAERSERTKNPDSVIRDTKRKGGKTGGNVMMIGDGMNDSTSMAAATVGVAMGAGGSAMTVAAAHVVLLTENLLLLPPTITLSQMACSVIIQNCFLAIGTKIVAIIFALTGHLELWHAILIDVGSLVVVVMNGTRPLNFKGYYEALENVSVPPPTAVPS